MAEGHAAVSPALRDLGWYAWASAIDKGRAAPSELLAPLRRHVRDRQLWLANHSFEPNTEGEARHQQATAWCEKAESLIAQIAAPSEPREEKT
jgi:hypothetical protein